MGLYRGHIGGIGVKNKMETTIKGLGLRILRFRV